jgi:hypothetical protein
MPWPPVAAHLLTQITKKQQWPIRHCDVALAGERDIIENNCQLVSFELLVRTMSIRAADVDCVLQDQLIDAFLVHT